MSKSTVTNGVEESGDKTPPYSNWRVVKRGCEDIDPCTEADRFCPLLGDGKGSTKLLTCGDDSHTSADAGNHNRKHKTHGPENVTLFDDYH